MYERVSDLPLYISEPSEQARVQQDHGTKHPQVFDYRSQGRWHNQSQDDKFYLRDIQACCVCAS